VSSGRFPSANIAALTCMDAEPDSHFPTDRGLHESHSYPFTNHLRQPSEKKTAFALQVARPEVLGRFEIQQVDWQFGPGYFS